MEPRLGELLVRGGVVTRQQLSQALGKEGENGSSAIQELVRLGFTTEDNLAEFLAAQFAVERVNLETLEINESVFDLVPPEVLQKHQLLPVKLLGSTLTVATADPTNLIAINEIQFITGYGVRPVLATPTEIKKFLDRRYGKTSYDEVLKKFGDDGMEVV